MDFHVKVFGAYNVEYWQFIILYVISMHHIIFIHSEIYNHLNFSKIPNAP